MKIGILSDTHKRLKRAKRVIDLLVEHDVEHIIHAGDIVREEVLEYIKKTRLPYSVVYGNNDMHLLPLERMYDIQHEPYCFSIEQTSFTLMHHPLYIAKKSDVMIYGHTHTFEAKMQKGVLVLNPGEACARNKPLIECALLEIKKERFLVTYFYQAAGTRIWTHKNYTFERSLNE